MITRTSSSVALLLLIVFAGVVRADTWYLPKEKKYYSADKKYRLEVIPKKLESQLAYFKDKSEAKDDAGAVKGLKDNRAKAVFSVRSFKTPKAFANSSPVVGAFAPTLGMQMTHELNPERVRQMVNPFRVGTKYVTQPRVGVLAPTTGLELTNAFGVLSQVQSEPVPTF
jgi:hypothetical protein